MSTHSPAKAHGAHRDILEPMECLPLMPSSSTRPMFPWLFFCRCLWSTLVPAVPLYVRLVVHSSYVCPPPLCFVDLLRFCFGPIKCYKTKKGAARVRESSALGRGRVPLQGGRPVRLRRQDHDRPLRVLQPRAVPRLRSEGARVFYLLLFIYFYFRQIMFFNVCKCMQMSAINVQSAKKHSRGICCRLLFFFVCVLTPRSFLRSFKARSFAILLRLNYA